MENKRFKQEREAEKAVSVALIMIIVIIVSQVILNLLTQ